MTTTRISPLRRALIAAAILTAAARTAAAAGVPESRVLPNGLRVVLLEDHALPVVSVSLWVGSGSKQEADTSAGYAHYLEHLIQRGTDTTGPFEYTRRAHRWGGGLSVRSNYDRTYITLSGVASAVDDMIDATAAMGLHASLKDSEIDLELGTLTQEVRTYYDLPSSVAFLETMRAAFPDHPYRVPMLGNFRSIGTLKSEPLTAFYRNLYVPNNMAIAVAGDFDARQVSSRIEAAFGGAARSATLAPSPPPPATFAGHSDVEKRLDFGDSWTTLSFVGPGFRHPDRVAFEVLAAALAEPSSPLTQEVLRSKTGTVAQTSYYGLEDAGMLYVALTPGSPETSYDVAAAAMRGLATVRRDGVPEAALRDLVARLLRDERVRASTVTERSERLGEAALFGGARYYWDRPLRLAAITPADIARVAARYLIPENLRLVVLLPKATGELPDASKQAFHAAFETLPASGGNPSTGFEHALWGPADAARCDASAWGGGKGAPLDAPQRTVLKNGVTALVVEDHRQPLVGLSLYLRAGSALDPPDREGTAGMMLRVLGARTAALLRGGQPAHPARPPALLPEAQVMRDGMEIRMLADPADLEAALAALAGAVADPAAQPTEIEPARAAALGTLARADRDPEALTMDLFHEKVYAGGPYAHRPDGTPTGLKAVTAEDLGGFGAVALQPARAVIAIAGDIDAGAAARLVEKTFAGWKPGKAPDERPGAKDKNATTEAAGQAGTEEGQPAGAAPAATGPLSGEFSRLVNAPQSRVLVGVPSVPLLDPAFPTVRALGAAITLLAFEDMVFARRVAFSAVSIPEGLQDDGALAAEVVCAPGRRREVQFDLQRLLRRMSAEPMAADDLRDVGRMLAGREAAAAQGVLPLASALAYREAAGLGAASWRDGFDASAPDAARVRTLAEKYLRPDRWITAVVGPSGP